MGKRDKALDIAKGIAIVFMVIGHGYSKDNQILKVIYAFHMPAFFMISGMIYSEKFFLDNYVYSFRKFVQIMIPYFIYSMVYVAFVAVLNPLTRESKVFCESVMRILNLKGVSVYWYLPCVGIIETIFMKIYQIKREVKYHMLIVINLVALLLLWNRSDEWLVIRRILIGFVFWEIGFFGRKCLKNDYSIKSLCILSIVFVIAVNKNESVSLVSMKLGNPVLYFVHSIIGSILLLQVAARAVNCEKMKYIKKGIMFYGKNTLCILCTHIYLVEIIRLLDYKLFDNILYTLGLMEGIILGGMVMILEVIIIKIVNDYFPYTLGKIPVNSVWHTR